MAINKLTGTSTPIQVQDKINEIIDGMPSGGAGIYQETAAATGTVSLQDDVAIYTHTPSSNTTYTFSTTNLTQTGKVITFEFLITMGATVRTLTFNNVTWLNGEIPALSVGSQKYLLAFRSFDDGLTWIGNLQGWY